MFTTEMIVSKGFIVKTYCITKKDDELELEKYEINEESLINPKIIWL